MSNDSDKPTIAAHTSGLADKDLVVALPDEVTLSRDVTQIPCFAC
jgi:hypothetical protein